MAELLAPRDGDVTVNCFLPSGSIVEVQLYFKKGEDAYSVALRELGKEGLSHSLMPQIATALKDVFLAERRYTPITERVGRKAFTQPAKKKGRWADYTLQFSTKSALSHLRALQAEARALMDLLKADRAHFYESSQLADDTSFEAHKAIEKAEAEFHTREDTIVQSFWARLGSESGEALLPTSTTKSSAPEFSRVLSVSIGTLRKRQLHITVQLTDDMFLEAEDDWENEDRQCLTHQENVYTAEMTALCLPVAVQDVVPGVLPDLIRRCEESPELHFPSVREQVEKLGALGTAGNQFVGFTRHSNIGLASGAFHLTGVELIKPLLSYCDRSSIARLVIPVCEWLEDLSVRDTTEKFLTSVKQGLLECSEGDLRDVVLTLDTDVRECRSLVDSLVVLFSDELLPD